MTPLALFRVVAVAEACSWLGLLIGMYLKYVPETTEAGVKLFGPIHGGLFVVYCVGVLVMAVLGRWSLGRTLLGLVCSVPPFMTLWFDWYAERRGWLARSWGREASRA